MHHPTRLLAYGFVVILIMMIFLSFIAFHTNQDTSLVIGQTVTKQLEKIKLVSALYSNIENRTRFIQSLLLDNKAFNKDEVWKDFDQFTTNHTDTSQTFLKISSNTENEILIAMEPSIEVLNRSSRQVLILLLKSEQGRANKILLDEVFRESKPILEQFTQLSRSLNRELKMQLYQASSDNENSQVQFVIYAVFTVLISLGIAIFAIWYNQKLSTQLEEINTYLEDKVDERTESLLDAQKELLEDNSELARLASTDNLTGLSNRSYMSEILEKEYSRFMRHNDLFGLIMLDIDHFKKINDDYGHDMGDKVLVQLSRQLELAIRNSDYISRWGGEEFLICSTTINADDLFPIAETIRLKIAGSEYEIDEGITASLGCAIIQPEEGIEQLIKRADVALYAAKNNGRNQTVVSEFNQFI